MKCIIRGEHFKQLISKGGRIAEHKAQNPLLESVLFSASKESKSLRAETTNLELWAEYCIPAAVEREGKTLIPARPLSALAPSVRPNDEITLEQEGNILKITTNTGKTALHGYQSEGFPAFPFTKKEGIFTIKNTILLPLLKRALVSCAQSSLKPELASILMRFSPNELIIASTDGFRLTEDRVPKSAFRAYPQSAHDALIPSRSLEEIIRMFEGDDEEITGSYHEKVFGVSSSFASMFTRTTEGAFPHYEEITPSHFAVSCAVPRALLVDVLRQAGIFSGKLYALSLSFSSKNNELLFHTFNQDVGEFSSLIAVNGAGEDREIVCNWRYFFDGVQGFFGDTITLSFSNESTPLLMRDPSGKQGFYLVMPMRGV